MARSVHVPYDRRHEWGAHARGGMVTLMLWQGAKLSNKDIGRMCGITRYGAQKMMENLSLWFPLVFEDGFWVWMARE
jgi:hypothetical protein